MSKQRKSYNEYKFNNLKNSFSKNLNIDTNSLDQIINNISDTVHKPLMKYNNNKQFNKTIYQVYTNKENKGNIPISFKNKLNNTKSNNFYKKQCHIFNIKRNSMEMRKIFSKKMIYFLILHKIYNVNSPI